MSASPSLFYLDGTHRYVGALGPDPRRILYVAVSELHIDVMGQRDTDDKSSERQVDSIAANFDWLQLEVPTVVRRNGMLYVAEGQHRVLAIQKRDPETVIPVLLLPGVVREKEAEIALAIDGTRRKFDAWARWKLKANKGELHERLANKALDDRGLLLNSASATNGIMAVGSLSAALHRFKDPAAGAQHMADVLDVIAMAWDNPSLPRVGALRYQGVIISAVDMVIYTGRGKIDYHRLAEIMKKQKPGVWLSDARDGDGDSPSERMARMWLSQYNYKRKYRIELPSKKNASSGKPAIATASDEAR